MVVVFFTAFIRFWGTLQHGTDLSRIHPAACSLLNPENCARRSTFIVYRRFLRQALPLFISLVVIFGLSVVVKRIGRETPKPFDRLIIEALPEVPDVSGWPVEFLERLEAAHDGLQEDETQREALVELARLYQANGFTVQAQSCYLGLESFEPQNPEWPYQLGVVMADSRDKRVVAQHLVDSLELDPENSEAYLRLGYVYLDTGMFEEAREVFTYRLQAMPEDPWAGVGMGQLLLYQNRNEESLEWLRRSKELDDRIESIYDLMYEAYLNLGDVQAASRIRKEGESKQLDSEWIDPNLGFLSDYCYDKGRLVSFARERRKTGDLEGALTLLQRAAGIDPNDPEIVSELQEVVRVFESQ